MTPLLEVSKERAGELHAVQGVNVEPSRANGWSKAVIVLLTGRVRRLFAAAWRCYRRPQA